MVTKVPHYSSWFNVQSFTSGVIRQHMNQMCPNQTQAIHLPALIIALPKFLIWNVIDEQAVCLSHRPSTDGSERILVCRQIDRDWSEEVVVLRFYTPNHLLTMAFLCVARQWQRNQEFWSVTGLSQEIWVCCPVCLGLTLVTAVWGIDRKSVEGFSKCEPTLETAVLQLVMNG